MESSYKPHLVEAGLTPDQAALYETLVRRGSLTARKATLEAGVSRTLGYAVLKQLEGMGLVEKKDEPGSVSMFTAAHPLRLQELSRERIKSAEQARISLEGVLSSLVSDFNTLHGQPGIRVLEGIDGVRELYEDVLNTRQDIRLIRSPLDDSHPGLAEVVVKQIGEQVRMGIRTRALTPLEDKTPESLLKYDAQNLVTRRILPREHFSTPAQILIYGDCVAITSYENPLMTTIITNRAIRDTHATMFEYIWNAAEGGDASIRAQMRVTTDHH